MTYLEILYFHRFPLHLVLPPPPLLGHPCLLTHHCLPPISLAWVLLNHRSCTEDPRCARWRIPEGWPAEEQNDPWRGLLVTQGWPLHHPRNSNVATRLTRQAQGKDKVQIKSPFTRHLKCANMQEPGHWSVNSLCPWLLKNFTQITKTPEWVKSLSHVQLFVTLWTVAYQTPLSMGFFRQEYWSGLPFPSPGDLADPGIEPGSPTLQADALTSEPPGKPH